MLRITGWVPKPGLPLPVPLISDDTPLFPEATVRAVKDYLLVRSAKHNQASDDFLVGVAPWRASVLKCPLADKTTKTTIATFKFWAAQPYPNPKKLVIVGPYLGCYR